MGKLFVSQQGYDSDSDTSSDDGKVQRNTRALINPAAILDLAQMNVLLGQATTSALEKTVQDSRNFFYTVVNHLKSPVDTEWASCPLESHATNLSELIIKPEEVCILFYGAMGAGKTATIHSILGIEGLLPECNSRAGTAVVTSIHHNEHASKETPYKVEVEYIDRASWERDLNIAIREFTDQDDEDADENEVETDNKEAAKAWSRISAVYPYLDKEDLEDMTAEELMSDESAADVLNLLGEIVESSHATTREVRKHVEDQLNRQDFNAVTSSSEGQEPHRRAFWPLVKEVRIHMKHDLLASGIVLVDLPGLNDSNPARAAVAEDYKLKAAQHFVVAPIQRAVDDALVSELLERGLHQQLQFDGAVESLVLVLTKADAMNISAAEHDFPDDLRLMELIGQSGRLIEAQNELRGRIDGLRSGVVLEDQRSDSFLFSPFGPVRFEYRGPDWRRAMASEADLRDPRQSKDTNKRPLPTDSLSSSPNKRPRTQPPSPQETLLAAEHQLHEIETQINLNKNELAVCARSLRNEHTKTDMRRYWNNQIEKLITRSNKLSKKTGNSKVDISTVDLDKTQCFCVSNTAFQALSGRALMDHPPAGFVRTEDTGIPQLVEYCRTLVDGPVRRAHQEYLRKSIDLFNDLVRWTSSTDVEQKEDPKLRAIRENIESQIEALEKDIVLMIEQNLSAEIKQLQTYQVLVNGAHVKQRTVGKILAISKRWQKTHWATARTICAHHGGPYMSSTKALHDWNETLVAPIKLLIRDPYDTLFTKNLPLIIDTLSTSLSTPTTQTLTQIRAQISNKNLKSGLFFKQVAVRFELGLQRLVGRLNELVKGARKEAWRMLVPAVRRELGGLLYGPASQLGGIGSSATRKALISRVMQENQHHLIDLMNKTLAKRLTDLQTCLYKTATQEVQRLCKQLVGDCQRIVKGMAPRKGRYVMKEGEVRVRGEVAGLQRGFGGDFVKGMGEGKVEMMG